MSGRPDGDLAAIDGRRVARLPCPVMGRTQFAINRMLCPRLEVAEFLRLAAAVGLEQAELRNDPPEYAATG